MLVFNVAVAYLSTIFDATMHFCSNGGVGHAAMFADRMDLMLKSQQYDEHIYVGLSIFCHLIEWMG